MTTILPWAKGVLRHRQVRHRRRPAPASPALTSPAPAGAAARRPRLACMGILIDPPRWPAHGTVFSHLISDADLAELHAFAAAAGISRRAFDRDHYDVPVRRYADLVALGAREVEARALARSLMASGLRIPARERSTSLRRPLLFRWSRTLPGQPRLGEELLERWSEPHRHYHDRTHLLAVLESLDLLLTEPGANGVVRSCDVVLAAWFHDAIHDGTAGEDEENSALLARGRLADAGHPTAQVDEVARLIRLTSGHQPAPDDAAGALLCDADLSVLGRSEAGYQRYTRAVRAEYSTIPDTDFIRGRAAVLERLLSLDPLFHTGRGRKLWEEAAHRNLRTELNELSGRR